MLRIASASLTDYPPGRRSGTRLGRHRRLPARCGVATRSGPGRGGRTSRPRRWEAAPHTAVQSSREYIADRVLECPTTACWHSPTPCVPACSRSGSHRRRPSSSLATRRHRRRRRPRARAGSPATPRRAATTARPTARAVRSRAAARRPARTTAGRRSAALCTVASQAKDPLLPPTPILINIAFARTTCLCCQGQHSKRPAERARLC